MPTVLKVLELLAIAATTITAVCAQAQNYDSSELVSEFLEHNPKSVDSNGNRKPYLLQIDVCEGKVEEFSGNGELIPKGVKMIGLSDCNFFVAGRMDDVGKEILKTCPIGTRCHIESSVVGDSGIPFIVQIERIK
jgi:hypothetical protein